MLWNKDLFPNWSLAFCAAFFWWHSWGKPGQVGTKDLLTKWRQLARITKWHQLCSYFVLCSHLEIEPRAFLSLTGASIHLPPSLWPEQQKFQTSTRVHLWFIGTLHWWLAWAIYADMGELLLVVFFVSLSVVAVVCVRYWVGELPCTVRWA